MRKFSGRLLTCLVRRHVKFGRNHAAFDAERQLESVIKDVDAGAAKYDHPAPTSFRIIMSLQEFARRKSMLLRLNRLHDGGDRRRRGFGDRCLGASVAHDGLLYERPGSCLRQYRGHSKIISLQYNLIVLYIFQIDTRTYYRQRGIYMYACITVYLHLARSFHSRRLSTQPETC